MLVLVVIAIGVIKTQNKNRRIEEVILEFVDFDKNYAQITSNYITKKDIEKFKDSYDNKINLVDEFNHKNEKLSDIISKYSELINNFKSLNEIYVEKTIETEKEFFDNIYGISLDEQQRRAVVVDDLNNIIIAGAGSGKTLTIAAKIKYLIEVKKVDPGEILCISFTNASVQGLKEKNKEYDVDTTTFHKLGLKILKEYHENNVYIADEQTLNNTIAKFFKEYVIEDIKLTSDVVNFFAYYINPPIDMDEFENLGEYYDQQKGVDLVTFKEKFTRLMHPKVGKQEENLVTKTVDDMRKYKYTLHGEIVKSEQELIIANYLFINGINYEYETQYKCSLEPYKPDFYLTDYDIYLEHFGVNRKNKTPWLSKIEEIKYINTMYNKREVHKKHNSKLIETYTYNFDNGEIFNVLDDLMEKIML